MKRFTILIPLTLLIAGVAYAAPAPKVTICHATSAADNPWTRIVVSENAIGGHFENPGTPKAGHEDDLLLQGDVACPAPPDDPTPPPPAPAPTPTPTPTPSPTPSPTPEPAPTPNPTPSPSPTPKEEPKDTPYPKLRPQDIIDYPGVK